MTSLTWPKLHACGMATKELKCPICGLILLTLKLYVSHLRLVHAKDTNFNIMCGVSGCREVFRAFSAFNSHVYRHHRDAIGVATIQDSTLGHSSSSAAPVQHGSDYEIESDSPVMPSVSATTAVTCDIHVVSDVRKKAAKFLLSLRDGRQISQAALTDVITGCKDLCQHTIMAIKEKIEHRLVETGVELPGLFDIFDADCNPFYGVHTNHLLERFCIDHLGCLVS